MKRLYLFLLIGLLILLVLPKFLGSYELGIFIMIFFYAYLGQCWNVLTGYTGSISLGHALYVGIGAYTSTRLAIVFGLSPWAGMFIGALLAMAVGLSIGFLDSISFFTSAADLIWSGVSLNGKLFSNCACHSVSFEN